jgi:5'-nucleotidase
MLRILLCNDDGVYAPGLKALKEHLSDLGEVIIVAPLTERSTTGHTLTLDHPLRIVEIEKNVYGCSGFPADCTLMGLGHIFKDKKPTLVISGINKGANLGQDIYYSGTVAAAREATFHGVRAIAVSLVVDFSNHNERKHFYETAAKVVRLAVQEKLYERIPEFTVLNINVPNLPFDEIKAVKFAVPGFRDYSEDIEERIDFRKRQYFWIGGIYRGHKEIANTDAVVVDQGGVSLSFLSINSNEKTDDKLSKILEDRLHRERN